MTDKHPSPTLDQERQATARQYAHTRRRLMLVNLLLGGLYTIAWLAFDISTAVTDSIQDVTSNVWLVVLVYGLIFGAAYILPTLPLSYYSGFLLPHRYGQSNQTLALWVSDQLKGLAIGGSIGLLLLEGAYWLLRVTPQLWWLWAGLAYLSLTVILSSLFPILIAPLFFKFTPLDDNDLTNRLTSLARKANTQVRGVYRFDMSRRTKSANAALMGIGNTRRIVLGDTLLDQFTPDEIETILAHELGHHVHNDLWLGIGVQSMLTLSGLFLANLGLRAGVDAFDFASIADIATLPLLSIIMGLFGLLTMPLGNGYSRWRERKADQYALRSSGKPNDFAKAMTRLANQNLADVDPEPWVEFLLHSHPAINKRVAAAKAYANSHP